MCIFPTQGPSETLWARGANHAVGCAIFKISGELFFLCRLALSRGARTGRGYFEERLHKGVALAP